MGSVFSEVNTSTTGLPKMTLPNTINSLRIFLRYEMFNNFYLMGKANALVNEFVDFNNSVQKPDFFSGYSLGFGYNFALGPLEISAMYSDQTKKIRSYINLGISF